MKGIIITVCFCITMFSVNSCKKSSAVMTNINATITGNWELSGYSGMGGIVPIAAGNGYKWRFDATKFYQYINDRLADTGTYTIIKDSSMTNVIMVGELHVTGYKIR